MSLREEIEEFAHDTAELEQALDQFAQHPDVMGKATEAIVLGDRLARRAYNITARLVSQMKKADALQRPYDRETYIEQGYQTRA